METSKVGLLFITPTLRILFSSTQFQFRTRKHTPSSSSYQTRSQTHLGAEDLQADFRNKLYFDVVPNCCFVYVALFKHTAHVKRAGVK